jgi:hypothetical protein
VGKGYHIVCHKRATQVSRLYLVVHNGVVQAYPGLRGKTVLRADRWYHIAYIVTGTKEKGGKEYIFLNGVLDATSASMWEGMTDNTILKIGGLGPKSERYQGLIDELRISNVARTYPGMAKEG